LGALVLVESKVMYLLVSDCSLFIYSEPFQRDCSEIYPVNMGFSFLISKFGTQFLGEFYADNSLHAAKGRPSKSIIMHHPYVYYKNRKTTICPAIAEIRLPVSKPHSTERGSYLCG